MDDHKQSAYPQSTHSKGSATPPPLPADTATKLKLWRVTSLICYAATLLLTFNWLTWYSPPTEVPRALLLLILVVPLVLPVRGFIHGRAMSYVAIAMVAMWLFAAGLDIAFYIKDWSLLGWALVTCSVILFVACYFYLRYLPRPAKIEQETTPQA